MDKKLNIGLITLLVVLVIIILGIVIYTEFYIKCDCSDDLAQIKSNYKDQITQESLILLKELRLANQNVLDTTGENIFELVYKTLLDLTTDLNSGKINEDQFNKEFRALGIEIMKILLKHNNSIPEERQEILEKKMDKMDRLYMMVSDIKSSSEG